jgi:ABC-type polysaccharide/polyol phosphate transport system ATPase subunit
MPLEEIVSPTPEAPDEQVASRPVVVEVRDLAKTFEIPLQRVDSIKERVLHPFASGASRSLTALRGISFDVHKGEFFGIVGRNGTGKSTLLKILASIYAADAGTIRMAGRVAPFIELGVGFNVDLTARENVVLNGVMMGLSREQSEGRVDEVIEFAELEEFSELKLKNYSSGMLVRLAFALMLQVDADILIFDEVLAVGDASFQQRCAAAFRDLREQGKTIVLVTHDMHAVEKNCERAMILEAGRLQAIGAPAEIAREYLEINMRRHVTRSPAREHRSESAAASAFQFERVWIEDMNGAAGNSWPSQTPLAAKAAIVAREDAPESFFSLELRDGEGAPIAALPYRSLAGDGQPIRAGDRYVVTVKMIVPEGFNSFFVHCAIAADPAGAHQLVLRENAASFLGYDAAPPELEAQEYEFDIDVQRENGR